MNPDGAAARIERRLASPVPPRQPPEPDEKDPGPRPEARRPGFHWMDVVFGLDLLVIGFLLIGNAMIVWDLLQGRSPTTGSGTVTDLWVNSLAIVVLFLIVPVLWVGMTRQGGWRGVRPYFGLDQPYVSMAWGAAIALGWLLIMAIAGLILTQFDIENDNENLQALITTAIIPAAIFASFAAGFGEEIFFRGILQRHIGVWGQAAVFGVFHVWQGPIAIAMTFLFALALGYMRKHGVSMWALIWGHTFFDLTVFAILLGT